MAWMVGQTLINGFMTGAVYALVAIGITIVFGVMKIINFAAGSYLMIGMYFTYICFQLLGWESYLLLPFVIVLMALLAILTFKLCIGPSMKRGGSTPLLVTIGLGMVLQNIIQVIFGTLPLSVPSSIKDSSISIGPFSLAWPRVIALAVALVVVYVVHFIMNKTLLGRAMRATSENAEVAKTLGINTDLVFISAFVMGIVMAGICGLLFTPIYFVSPNVGNVFRTVGVMIVVMGGLGSIKGSLICGMLTGMVEAVFATFISQYVGQVGIFILFLVMLVIRPRGLLGEGARVS